VATTEQVTCDACGKVQKPGAKVLLFYVERRSVPAPKPQQFQKNRRRLRTTEDCEFDICSAPACRAEIASILERMEKIPCSGSAQTEDPKAVAMAIRLARFEAFSEAIEVAESNQAHNTARDLQELRSAAKPKPPPYNHTRGDGPFDPCRECFYLMSKDELMALADDLRACVADLQEEAGVRDHDGLARGSDQG
jgi:hypothetical protein